MPSVVHLGWFWIIVQKVKLSGPDVLRHFQAVRFELLLGVERAQKVIRKLVH